MKKKLRKVRRDGSVSVDGKTFFNDQLLDRAGKSVYVSKNVVSAFVNVFAVNGIYICSAKNKAASAEMTAGIGR